MAIGTAAVTFDIADQLGNDFDPRRTKVWITTNVPGDTVIDKAGNKIRLGSGNVTLNADGTGSMLVWVPGADANPSSWQTIVHVDYPDRNKAKGRASKSFGPFTITANADLADLVAEMPVQPEYLATVLATVQDMIDEATDSTGPALAAIGQRVNGYTDHGNLSGAVTFNGPTASHRFDATGPTTITLAGFGEGGVATLICFSGAEDVTVNNAGDVELVDATAWSAEYARGTWISGGGGGTPVVVDPPLAAPASLAATNIEEETATVTWAAVSGAAGYAFRVDGGTWQDLGNVLTRNLTGLLPDVEYDVDVAAYVTFANRGTIKSVTFRTDAPVVQPTVVETFNGAEGISLTAYDSPVGIDWIAPQYNNNGIGDEVAVIRNNAAWRASSAVPGGGGRFVSVSRDLRITVAYSFPNPGNTNDQLRIFGRGDIRIILDRGGQVRTDTDGLAQTFAAGVADFPAVGTLSLEIIDTAGKVYRNGVQVGTFTLSTSLNDTDWGFYCYQQTVVTDFRVETVTGASPAPSLTPGKPYAPGTVITSDAFTGADAASIHNRVPDATLGGAGRSPWYQTDSTAPFALTGNKLVRSGTTFGGVALYAGQQDVELKATLATVPVGGSLRLYIRKQGGEGVGDGLWLNVSDTAITPQQQGGTALTGATSFGAPQVGDVYTVSMSGSTATFTAKRSGGASIGAGTQTFTGTSYATKYPLLSIVATGGTSAVAVDDVIVSGA